MTRLGMSGKTDWGRKEPKRRERGKLIEGDIRTIIEKKIRRESESLK